MKTGQKTFNSGDCGLMTADLGPHQRITRPRLKQARLITLLCAIGAVDQAQYRRDMNRGKFDHGPSLESGNEQMLWDLYDRAKAAWIKNAKAFHPDRNGDHEKCVLNNQLWERIKFLFSKHGIEPI